jgi:hypothetical protein
MIRQVRNGSESSGQGIPLEAWRDLYEAHASFGALEPWEDFHDGMLFAVRDPTEGPTGYACVLGGLGEVYALLVYRGAYGLDIHRRMQCGEIGPGTPDVFAIQDCLMAEFTDREELGKPDRDVIRSLRLKFRGAKSWPLFRSHLPGYVPWYLTGSEVAFLTLALRCACDVVRRVREEKLDLEDEEGRTFTYALVSEAPGGSGYRLGTGWEETPTWQSPPQPSWCPAPEELAGLHRATSRPGGVWEVSSAFLQGRILDRERPYYSRIILIAHGGNGMILHTEVVAPEVQPSEAVGQGIWKTIRQTGQLPEEVRVTDPTLAEALADFGKKVGFRVKRVSRLPAIEEARASLGKFMEG